MTTSVKVPLLGASFTENGGLTFEGAETLGRMTAAVQELQVSPVFANGEGPILTSPNGTQYRLTVDDAGNLSAAAV